MNEITKTENKNTNLQVSKEQQVLMPIAEQYIQLFPEIANDKTFNAKQAIISMALKLKETKDKAGRPAIDVCTRESIMTVAQEVLVKKLDIMKSQAALLVRGDRLMLQPEYFGNVKRSLELNPFLAYFTFAIIYKDDKVELEIAEDGGYRIKSHKTSIANIGKDKVVACYANAVKKDGTIYATELMTMEEIKMAWSQSSNSSLSVHSKFWKKMCRKTVLNSLCTWLINTTGETENEYFADQDEEDFIRPQGMEITLDEGQDYEEPTYEEEVVEPETNEFDDEEVSDDEWEMAMEEDSRNEVETVPYAKWKNELKGNGYEMVEGSYDTVNKTVQVRKV
jgi:recombination protein RecT